MRTLNRYLSYPYETFIKLARPKTTTSNHSGECMTGQAKSATLLAQMRAAIQAAVAGTDNGEGYLLSRSALDVDSGRRLDGLPIEMVYQLGAIASVSTLAVATGSWLQPESVPIIPLANPDQSQSDLSDLSDQNAVDRPISIRPSQTVAAPENLPTDHALPNAERLNSSGTPSTTSTISSTPISATTSVEQQQLTALQAQTPILQQQLASLQNELRSLHQQNGLTNIPIDVQRFGARLDNLATQQTTLQEKLNLAQRQQAEQLQQLNISPHSQIALRILNTNLRYRALLENVSAIDQQLVNVTSQVTFDMAQLQALQRQYQEQSAQLNEEAQQSLQLYIKSSNSAQDQSVYVTTTMIQDSAYLTALQQAVETAHQIEMLQIRQHSIAVATPYIQQRQQQMMALMQNYRSLAQRIQTASTQFDRNLSQVAMLKNNLAQAHGLQRVDE